MKLILGDGQEFEVQNVKVCDLLLGGMVIFRTEERISNEGIGRIEEHPLVWEKKNKGLRGGAGCIGWDESPALIDWKEVPDSVADSLT
jgi:hypothetical protein